MTTNQSKPIFNFYFDDSGTRHPDRRPTNNPIGDWFALGGILVKSEDEALAREMHFKFCQKWKITYPLHSVKIRHKTEEFAWLAKIDPKILCGFFNDLNELVISFPAVSHACVIDRPGYHSRYEKVHEGKQWSLCKTAFCVLSERVAKFAQKSERRVRMFAEKTDKQSDRKLTEYFKEMRNAGMPFAPGSSEKYGPLSSSDLKFTLIELGFRTKACPLTQMADLFLYPMCRGGYDESYAPIKLIREHKKTVESYLLPEEASSMGIKYSCFDN